MSTHPLSAPALPRATSLSPRRWRMLRILLGLQVAALAAMYLSGHWDAAEHAKGAVDSFWYAPHYGIYFAILAAALLSAAGLLLLVWGTPLTPFQALRGNAALTLVVVANLLGFTGAPADALWHEIFGIDLTVWSPPHLHLLLGEILAALACVVYFLPPPRAHDDGLEPLTEQSLGRTLSIAGVIVLALLLAAFLFFEYEIGVRSRYVLARPRWAFPLLWTLFVCCSFGVVSAATRRVGMASAIALVYDLARLVVLAFDRSILDYEGSLGFPLLAAALPWDAVLFVAMRRRLALRWPVWLAAGAVCSAVLVLATPLFFSALGVAPELTVDPWRSYWPVALGGGVAGAGAGWWLGSLLRRLRPHEAAARSYDHGRDGRSTFGRETIRTKG